MLTSYIHINILFEKRPNLSATPLFGSKYFFNHGHVVPIFVTVYGTSGTSIILIYLFF